MIVALDLESTGLDFTTDTIRGIGLYDGRGYWYTDLNEAKAAIEAYKAKGARFVMHNQKFDTKFMARAGIYVECAFDTLLAARLVRERPHKLNLAALTSFFLGISSWKNDVDFMTDDLAALGQYCLVDCEMTYKLHDVLRAKLEEEDQLKFFEQLLMPASRMMSDVEYGGMCLDWARLARLKGTLRGEADLLLAQLSAMEAPALAMWVEQEIQRKSAKCKDVAAAVARNRKKPPTFNWASPVQVLWLLKHHGANCNVWNPAKKERVDSSNDEALEQNPHIQFCAILRDLREREKLIGALEGYEEIKSKSTGRIHCSFNLHVTETGRLSSSAPNLQNVDRGPRVRSLFVASPGHQLLVADLAQIEVRVAAHYSRDPKLIEMFTKGEDVYGTIATELLGADCLPNEVKARYPKLRAVAKVIGLSILYGVGAKRLRDGISRATGIEYSYQESAGIIRDYFERFEGLKELRMRVDRKLTKDGFLTGLFGRRLYVGADDIYMHGVNYLLQNSASDLMLFRQLEIEAAAKEQGLDQRLVSLVHDELIREVVPHHAEALKAIVKNVMERTSDLEFRTPLKVDLAIGPNWAVKS